MGWIGLDWAGWDLCVGLFYEHRFAVLIRLFSFGLKSFALTRSLVWPFRCSDVHFFAIVLVFFSVKSLHHSDQMFQCDDKTKKIQLKYQSRQYDERIHCILYRICCKISINGI